MPLTSLRSVHHKLSQNHRISWLVVLGAFGALSLSSVDLGSAAWMNALQPGVAWLYWILGMSVIAMAYGIFAVQWHQTAGESRRRTFWMGIGCFTAGVLDTLHSSSYVGVLQFGIAGLMQEAVYLWLFARLLLAVVCIIGSFLDYRPVRLQEKCLGLFFSVLSSAAILYLVIGKEGRLTLLNRSSRWAPLAFGFQAANILLLLAAGWRCWRRWMNERDLLDYYVVFALVFAIYAQVVFCLYGHMNSVPNLIGQIYNVICYLLFYRGLFILHVQRPYRELSLAYERLRASQRLSLLGQISSRFNHEVKNFLASVKGFAQLGQLSATEQKAREIFRRIEQSADEFAVMSSEITSMSRKTNTFEASEIVDMRELLGGIQYLWQPQISGKNIQLSFRYEIEAPKVLGNRQLLTSVLLNLLSNATQAVEMAGGGQIEVSVQVTGDAEKALLLAISDTGTGIPVDIQDHLFDELFTTKDEGTGLGLVICKEIVEKVHHGRIWFTSEVGKGTTFFVALPQVRL